MMPPPRPRVTRATNTGFTLIELLVVITIIALLIGILLPVLGSARDAAHNAQCLSNIRQWGVGTMAFATENKQAVPWEGADGDNPGDIQNGSMPTYQIDVWWGNAVMPYVDQDPYRKIAEDAAASGDARDVPQAGDDSFFICPSADMPSESAGDIAAAPYEMSFTSPKLYYVFHYVANSKLARGTLSQAWELPAMNGAGRVREPKMTLDDMRSASETVLMIDLRATRQEFEQVPGQAGSGAGNSAPTRMKAKWQELAARHSGNGNIVFGDGHAEGVSWLEANEREDEDYVDPNGPGYNRSGLVWSPLERAN